MNALCRLKNVWPVVSGVHRLTAVLTYAKSETELVKTGSDMSSSLIAFSSAALSSISSMRFFSSVMYGPRNGS